MKAYHVTTTKKVSSIKKQGLLRTHKRNVSLSKRNVNYVMADLLHAGFFASKMNWETDQPISIIHLKVDPNKLFKDLNTGAIGGAWYEYHDDIKSSQITKVESWDKKAKARHKKLMDKAFK